MSNRHDISLDVGVLRSTAVAETGIADFDDPTVIDRAGKVAEAYKSLGLKPQGQLIAAETILDVLVTRLKLGADRVLHPEIAQEEIRKPVVVVGFPRSGTTLLYALMAADPAARSPRWWDALHPSPPPGLSPGHDHVRRQISQREIAEFLQVVSIKPAHNFFVNGADMSLECYVLWGLDFRSLAPFLYFRAPGYPNAIIAGGQDDPGKDMIATYRFEKNLLQALQWRRPTGHWVLKDPSHHFFLPEMNRVFGDATFVWTHRDPVQVFASVVELTSIMTGAMARAHVDRRQVAKAILPMYVSALERVLNDPVVTAPNMVHVAYDELAQGGSAFGKKIYDKIGRDFSPDVQARIETYRANPNNRPDLYGKFRYALDDTGFSVAEIREHFKTYIEKFDIPSGKASG